MSQPPSSSMQQPQPVVTSSSFSQQQQKRKQEEEDEELLKNKLRAALRSLDRKSEGKPLPDTYKQSLMDGSITTRKPNIPKDKLYSKLINARLRNRVESFMSKTQGGDPFDVMSSREQINMDALRSSLTLRECKKHEQEGLLLSTVASFPRTNRQTQAGVLTMDERQCKRHFEEIVLGLKQERKNKKSKKSIEDSKRTEGESKGATPSKQQKDNHVDDHLLKQRQHQQREAARKRREENERKKAEEERQRIKQEQMAADTPKQKLHRFYQPIFQVLWDMEFSNLGNMNPFRIPITKENCASMGAADYFTIVEKPMNLTFIQDKVNNLEYNTLEEFIADVDLMLDNAFKYNSDVNNEYHIAAKEMQKKFKKALRHVIQAIHKLKQQEG